MTDFVAIDANTIELIKQKAGGDDTKVINLIKSIERLAEEESGDPFLIAMADRARQVQESYEDRQTSTQDALAELFREIERDQQRKREQAERGFDSLQFFVFELLREAGVENADQVSGRIRTAFAEHPHWKSSEAELRELRQRVTFAVYSELDDLGWCGKVSTARQIVSEIRDRWGHVERTLEGVQNALSNISPTACSEVGLLGHVIDGSLCGSFSVGTGITAVAVKGLTAVMVGGTGAPEFVSLAESFVQESEHNSSAAVRHGLCVAGALLHRESFGLQDLAEGFGGGYEFAYLVDGRFQKFGDVLYLACVMIDVGGDNFRILFRTAMRYSYQGDVLVIKTLDFQTKLDPREGETPRVHPMELFLVHAVDADTSGVESAEWVVPPFSCDVTQVTVVVVKDDTPVDTFVFTLTGAKEKVVWEEGPGHHFNMDVSEEFKGQLLEMAKRAMRGGRVTL